MIETETYYIIPKTKLNYDKIKNLKNFTEIFEDYKIKEATEKNINEMIDKYNFEEEISYFKRSKATDFLFCKVKEIKIGKYRSGKIEILDMWKN